MAAVLRGERGLLGDSDCTSAGKDKNKMGIYIYCLSALSRSDDSILICSLGKDPCIYICFS